MITGSQNKKNIQYLISTILSKIFYFIHTSHFTCLNNFIANFLVFYIFTTVLGNELPTCISLLLRLPTNFKTLLLSFVYLCLHGAAFEQEFFPKNIQPFFKTKTCPRQRRCLMMYWWFLDDFLMSFELNHQKIIMMSFCTIHPACA